MPVLSPHRSSSSGLSGSYRSTFSSSALERPFYGSSSYTPRFTSYSERYTTRTYTDSDGRRIYSRSGSINEDGVTTRFREESREPSIKRDSISRDSGISSIRENSISDYSRRDSSLTRGDRLSTANVIDSVAELRNKYSPANYVPACMRKNENIARSKSNNDIGLPPLELKASKKKVNDRLEGIYTNSVAYSNNTNTDNLTDEDDNGNRASVADLCKKFDDKLSRTVKNGTNLANKTPEVKSKISELTNGVKPLSTKAKSISVKKSSNNVSTTKKNDISSNNKCQNNPDVLQSNSKLEVNEEAELKNGSEVDRNGVTEETRSGHSLSKNNSRVNNFSSYISISTKDFQRGDDTQQEQKDISKNDMDNKEYISKVIQTNDLSTSPKLTKTAISPSNSIANNSINSNSLSLRSSERDSNRIRDYSDDDSSGERALNNYSTIRSFEGVPQKSLGLNGLKNIGNTCFMNSVIQCLSNTRWLLEYLKKDAYIRDINTSISSMKGALIKAFAEVIKELWSEDGSDRVVNTASLKSQIQRFAPRFMGYAQQDAQEFLRYLLEGLHEDVNRVQEKPKPILTEIDEKLSDSEKAQESWLRYLRMDNSKIVDNFVGQLKSTLKCTHCGHCSVTFDPFWDLSLPIPQRTGQLRLSQCLDSFTREETLDGDEKPTCSKCKERRRCTKSFSIHKFPKILVIHLKRFSPTERFRGKLNVTVDFPIEGLDMSHYAADNVAPCRYNLYAISNHSGTTYSGHYTAYCRHPYTGQWHEYNDSRVSSISSKSLVSGEAYVLFYEQEGTKSHL
ncbi:ubiquitin carboxyl-terminal hydrolase 2-like isoform X1 [Diorhabda sublineata]|uniref:ubiquitin carboxyl-terminal hydrolase 2-like isoform X1 n=1 Tax=Diorhabda sublineata TaxID=1163346 RepID=UPI0024E0DF59|nr:ubiquitin carboxyl-terminal hydrolase 2-like isoform X1 [Diorhabda sublineata]